MSNESKTQAIADELNDYDGIDIWNDVIYGSVWLDYDMLDTVDPNEEGMNVPTIYGTVVSYVQMLDEWV